MDKEQERLLKKARIAVAYNMSPARLSKILTSTEQKITRKNAIKLAQAIQNKYKGLSIALDKTRHVG